MKVKSTIRVFEPVTITFESQKELDFMWHKLNCGEGQKFTDYLKHQTGKFITNETREMLICMYDAFNESIGHRVNKKSA